MFFPIHSAGVEGDERAVGAAHRSVVEDGVAEVGHIVEGSAVLGEIVPFTGPARAELESAARSLIRHAVVVIEGDRPVVADGGGSIRADSEAAAQVDGVGTDNVTFDEGVSAIAIFGVRRDIRCDRTGPGALMGGLGLRWSLGLTGTDCWLPSGSVMILKPCAAATAGSKRTAVRPRCRY